MSYDAVWRGSFEAEANLAAKQSYVAKRGAGVKSCDLCDASAEPLGIIDTPVALGSQAGIIRFGTAHAISGAAITLGAQLGVDSSGRVVTLTAQHVWAIGTAEEAAVGAGELIEVTLNIRPIDGDLTVLAAETDGASGGDQIGITPIAELGAGDTAQEALEALSAQKVRGSVLTIPVSALASIANNDLLLNAFTPGFAGTIAGLSFATGLIPASTGGKDIDLQCLIGAVATTGGLLTLLTADINAKGKVKAATAITGANSFSATDTISVKCVQETAAFSEGNGVVLVHLGPPA